MSELSPKEKADVIYHKFLTTKDNYGKYICSRYYAIFFALTCVDQIVFELEKFGRETDELQNMENDFRYWENVKDELNKM